MGAAMGALTMGTGVASGHKDFKKRQQLMSQGVPAGQAFQEKASELTGSNPMPHGIDRMKTASMNPHIDITGKEPPTKVVRETGRYYALVKEGEARYPLDTAVQVQQAFTYFDKYASRFTPHERHVFCQNVSKRADALGLSTPDTVAKYGSAALAKDAGVQIYRRQRLFREGTGEHGLLQLDQLWDNGLDDPYYSVFGVEKVAEYSFVDGNDTITEARLKQCAKQCKKQVEDLFDEDIAEEFAKDPVQIFSSMPLDSKRILMRIAQSVEE
jgi:hypothetical protein